MTREHFVCNPAVNWLTMGHMNNQDRNAEIDELLARSDFGNVMDDIEIPVTVSLGEQMSTGTYDLDFFQLQSPGIVPSKPVTLALDDARLGLDLFLDEARVALLSSELTDDQRIHVSTIITYVEGLARRFDRIRSPEFANPTTD